VKDLSYLLDGFVIKDGKELDVRETSEVFSLFFWVLDKN
jgi:hypothetical protein